MLQALKSVRWYFAELMGDNDYRKYCDHLRAHHPGAQLPTERQYWRNRYASQDANPGARCC